MLLTVYCSLFLRDCIIVLRPGRRDSMINSADSLNDLNDWGRAVGQKGTARQVVGVVGNVSQVVLQMTAGWAVYVCQPYDCLLKTEQAHHRLKSVATAWSNPCVHRYNNNANVYVYLKISWEIMNFRLVYLKRSFSLV